MSDNSSVAARPMMALAQALVKQHGMTGSPKNEKKKVIKPLNAFMAFRSYYEGLFPGVEQKEKSGYLTFLWHQENDQARWTILAKAFTVIRDVAIVMEVPKPKLKEFLDLNAVFVGLPLPTQNISAEEAERYLTGVNNYTETIYVEDIVENSLTVGLLPSFTPNQNQNQDDDGDNDNQPVVTMGAVPSNGPSGVNGNVASATQNTAAANTSNIGASSSTVNNGAFEMIGGVPSHVYWHMVDVNMSDPRLIKLAESLTYQGVTNDEVEFSEYSEVQTDFNPFAGDPWTTYDIGVSSDQILSSLAQM